jgi:hypothetical protein
MAGSAAAVAAVPAMLIAVQVKEDPGDDPLLNGIRIHRKMIEAINALCPLTSIFGHSEDRSAASSRGVG